MVSPACVRAIIPLTRRARYQSGGSPFRPFGQMPRLLTPSCHCNFAATYSSILALLPMSAGEGGQHHGEHVMLALTTIARVAHAIEIAPAMSI